MEDGSGIFRLLGTDMHSHLLPGLDDGSPDLATSLQLVRGMLDLGYTKLVTTPHVLWDMYRNTRDMILQKQDLLREALQQQGIVVELQAAAEYFLDDHVEDLLRRNEPLLPISGNQVLCEFSLAYKPHGIKDILFELQMQGYQPVIAHPERYIYLKENKEFFEELRETGCLLQLNLLSVTGHYGKTVQELAAYLLKNDLYDLLGTDLHHGRHLAQLRELTVPEALMRLLKNGRFKNAAL